jgi:hypothetical protein
VRLSKLLTASGIKNSGRAEGEMSGTQLNNQGERTSAVGLFNYAESYRHAANRLHGSKARSLPFDAPIRFLYYHSIELYLKSCLRATGLSADEIRGRYGHSFVKLLNAAARFGCEHDDEDCGVIKLVDGTNYWKARYIETGIGTFPSLPGLARTTDSLALNGYVFLGNHRLPIRKPKPSPARLRA